MKFIITLLTSIIYFNTSYSQNTFSGKITNKEKNSLQGATIFISELQRVAVSDENGTYSFKNLPEEIVHVHVSLVGYKSQVKTFNIKNDSKLDFILETSPAELEEIMITSNNTKLRENIPFPVDEISQTELRKYSSPSLMGNLSYLPGIDKITIGNGIGKPVIRGLSFNQIMLYDQGTRIENQQWDDHHDLGLSDVGLESIEIVRGPSALIFGSDALGGALIFHEEKPAPAGISTGDLTLGFNSNTLGAWVDAGIKSTNNKGLFYGVRIGCNTQTSYLQGNVKGRSDDERFAFNSKYINSIGKGFIGISKNWGVSKFSYSFHNQLIGIIEDEAAENPGVDLSAELGEQREREIEAPHQDVSTHVLSLENTFFTKKSKVNLNIAYQANFRKEFEPLPVKKKKELAIGLDLNAVTYDAKWTSNPENKFGLTIGSQGTFLQNKNYGLESLVPDADITDVAGFTVLHYDLNKINILGGIRYDMRKTDAESYLPPDDDTLYLLSTSSILINPEFAIEKKYNPVSYSLGLAIHPVEMLTIKLNGATGFSAPNYAQLGTFGKHEGTFRFERGNLQLDVEQNLEGDGSLIWSNSFLTANFTGYINKVKDYIYIENTGDSIIRVRPEKTDTLPVYDYRQGDATLSGIEADISIHPSTLKWLNFNAGYSVISGELDAGGNLPYIPANKLTGELKFIKEKINKFSNNYFSVIVSNYAKQSRVTQYELATDGYTLIDLHVGTSFKIKNRDAFAEIFCTNLMDKAYYNHLSLVKYINVRDMGRSIGFTFKMPLYYRSVGE